jgi:TatD DNase family protein
MLPQFFDIHAHVNDSIFDQDRNAVFSRMQEKGVWAIQVGTDLKSSQQVAMMASFVEDGIYASIGIHPIDERNEIFREPFFAEIAKSRNVVAVGECGLDYSRLADVKDIAVEKERQRELFERQVQKTRRCASRHPQYFDCKEKNSGGRSPWQCAFFLTNDRHCARIFCA